MPWSSLMPSLGCVPTASSGRDSSCSGVRAQTNEPQKTKKKMPRSHAICIADEQHLVSAPHHECCRAGRRIPLGALLGPAAQLSAAASQLSAARPRWLSAPRRLPTPRRLSASRRLSAPRWLPAPWTRLPASRWLPAAANDDAAADHHGQRTRCASRARAADHHQQQ